MADIDLIIKIDEDDYKIMKHNIAVNNPFCPLSQEEMVSKVANGILLSEHHERLIKKIQDKIQRRDRAYLRDEISKKQFDIEFCTYSEVIDIIKEYCETSE